MAGAHVETASVQQKAVVGVRVPRRDRELAQHRHKDVGVPPQEQLAMRVVHALRLQRLHPGEHMLINTVDQRAVEIAQKSRLDVHIAAFWVCARAILAGRSAARHQVSD